MLTKLFRKYGCNSYRRRLINDSIGAYEQKLLWNFLFQLTHKEIGSVESNPGDISKLQDSHKNEKCLIVGSSPSMSEVPIHKIRSNHTFFLNRAFTLNKNIYSNSSSVVIGDAAAYKDYGTEINASDFNQIFLSSNINTGLDLENLFRFSYFQFPTAYDGYLQTDITKPLYHAHTVAIFAVQLAVAMGFTEIALLGIDLSFSDQKSHFYEGNAREIEWSSSMSKVRKDRMCDAFLIYNRALKSTGIKLINLSPMKSLPFLEWQDCEKYFD
ncbi:Protein of unknown function DUF115 [Pseudovibrio denitrificans]|uniref:6-hydroxymethylpterin diphosphokinase MptE-like domain-containing protein n=1 Tax=Pseudovibrio denitrificans TaxID=258256 RepID=A0A1I7D0X8_9HYPH|nr:6-hydroxymethylpterin diphosphokinase MptE-like protein [Pseudovibrio denitrificans]SFU05246.1 Protein of unknown function DUF115 [Pseudovibrio denitrificans]